MLNPSVVERLQRPDVSRLVIALSGGVDSVVLLDLIATLSPKRCVALHIDHQLQEDAARFAAFCRSLGEKYALEVVVRQVEVRPSGSLETAAREARYAAFEAFLEPGDLLLMAHHADDQVETILFRLFRGGGSFGISGMPEERSIGSARLYRPLLDLRRAQIEAYAQENGLQWCIDETNANLMPDRNFIRHELLPLIDQRFDHARQALLASQSRDARGRQRLQRSLDADRELIQKASDCLDLSALRQLPLGVRQDILVNWIDWLGVPQPGASLLQAISRTMDERRRVRAGFGNYVFREFEKGLYLLRDLPVSEPLPTSPLPASGHRLEIPGGYVSNNLSKGFGLKDGHGYHFCYRRGGEKLRRGRARSLKNLFQENHVPNWLRDRVPLVYCGDELVGLAGLPDWGVPMLVADGWSAASGEDGQKITLCLDERLKQQDVR